jgi:hypothetical protein
MDDQKNKKKTLTISYWHIKKKLILSSIIKRLEKNHFLVEKKTPFNLSSRFNKPSNTAGGFKNPEADLKKKISLENL